MPFLRTRLKTILITFAVVIVIIIAEYFGALRPLERVIAFVVEPIQVTLYRASDALRPLYTNSDEELIKENTALKERLASTVQSNDELAGQLSQYEEYGNQLNFAQQREYEFIPAEITSRIGQGISTQTISINLGKADGIIVGYPVVYNDGTLLGIIDSINETQAEVALLTSNLVTVQAATQSEGNAQGVVQGAFGTSLEMDLILKDDPIEIEDVIITNGKDKYIPKGLLIGTVQSVSDESGELFKSASVIQSVQYDTNSIVSVIVPN